MAEAGGEITVTELEATAYLRRLLVEFGGGLGSRNVPNPLDPIQDELGLEAFVQGQTVDEGWAGPASEVQLVELIHAQGGQFRLSFVGEATDWLDYDADNAADGQVTAGADLAFTYSPAGLPADEIALRARTKDYDHNGAAIYGDWFTLEFELTVSAQPLRITQLGLDNDTGSSSTDNSTADATLAGQVTGFSSSESITVEIDQDGDGTADTSAGADEAGAFTVSLTGLPSGLNTVHARAVSSADPARTSSWAAFSFVFSTEPDGAAAQDLVPVAAALNASSGASQGGYDDAVAAAQQAHDEASQEASSDYDQAVEDAVATRNDAVADAQNEYEQAVAAANAAYVAALQVAAAALASDLGSFSGDPTSFELQPFIWPAAPPDKRLTVPADSAQPVPPTAPDYTGPEFKWREEAIYQIAQAEFDRALYEAQQNADQALKTATTAAGIVFDAAKEAANYAYDQTIAEAEEAYRQALLDYSDEPFDLQEELQAHRDELQAAWDAYIAAAKEAARTFNTASQGAQLALDRVIAAADRSYQDAIDEANDRYSPVLSNPDSTPEEYREAAIGLNRDQFAAWRAHDRTIADARREYDTKLNAAHHEHQSALVAAWQTYQLEASASTYEFSDKVTTYNHWLETRAIAATRALEQARLGAARTRDKAVADAEKVRADAVALAERGRTIALANATAAHWRAEIEARQLALESWMPFGPEFAAWVDYQQALLDNEAAYIDSRATAYVTQATAVADAAHVQAQAVSAAAKARSYSKADAEWQRGDSRLAARATYWAVPADARQTRALADSAHLLAYRDGLATTHASHHQTQLNLNSDYADELSSTYYEDAIYYVEAPSFVVSSDPGSAYYYGGVWWPDSSVHSYEVGVHLTQVEFDNWVAMRDDSLGLQQEVAEFEYTLQGQLRDSRYAEAATVTAGLEAYQRSAASADKIHAVQLAHDQGTERKAIAAASVVFVTAQALADKNFAQADAGFRQTRTVADAFDEQTFALNNHSQFWDVFQAACA